MLKNIPSSICFIHRYYTKLLSVYVKDLNNNTIKKQQKNI